MVSRCRPPSPRDWHRGVGLFVCNHPQLTPPLLPKHSSLWHNHIRQSSTSQQRTRLSLPLPNRQIRCGRITQVRRLHATLPSCQRPPPPTPTTPSTTPSTSSTIPAIFQTFQTGRRRGAAAAEAAFAGRHHPKQLRSRPQILHTRLHATQ